MILYRDFQFTNVYNHKTKQIEPTIFLENSGAMASKLNEDSDLIELEDFLSNCECLGFIDSDGFGFLSDGKFEYDIEVYPSDFMDYDKSGKGEHKRKPDILKGFTHIVWYNK